jgi:nicotinamide riboside kinase
MRLTAAACLADTAGMSAAVIALLGAESTGKSTLAHLLGQSLVGAGIDGVVVPEALRDFCAMHGRTPVAGDQVLLADMQSARIRNAARRHAVVIADTTALMTAVYSDIYFNDSSLYEAAVPQQRACHLTLLAGADLPWVPDGLLPDGPHMRARVDARLREVLREQDIAFSVVLGLGPARAAAARAAVWRCLHPPQGAAETTRWRWVCQHCGDGSCEAAVLALSR